MAAESVYGRCPGGGCDTQEETQTGKFEKDNLIRKVMLFLVMLLLLALGGLTKQMSMVKGYTDQHRVDSSLSTLLSSNKNDQNIKEKYRYQMGIDYHMKNKMNNNTNTTICGEDVRDMVVPIPRNLHIAFVGDSLTRYMYMSLVHFLHYGSWLDPEDAKDSRFPKFLSKGGSESPSWMDYFNYTNSRFQPHEVCDCFRQDFPYAKMVTESHENRFYWDPVRNNSISYFQKWSRNPILLSWPADTLHSANHSIPDHKSPPMVEYTESQLIRNYLLQMKPAPPNVLILNGGLWKGHRYEKEQLQWEIVQALKDMNIIGIYKTTTKKAGETTMESPDYENQFCSKMPYCLNITWTAAVPRDLYVDLAHFREPIYKRMNFQLLELLSQIDQEHNDSLHIDVEEPPSTGTTSKTLRSMRG